MKIKNRCHSSIAIKGHAIGIDVDWVFGRIKRLLLMTLKIPINVSSIINEDREANSYNDFLLCQVSRFSVVAKDAATGLYRVSNRRQDKTTIYVAPELISKPVVIATLSEVFSLVLDCTC
jgi:hypothetical protein